MARGRKKLWQAQSLRTPKSPRLLDTGSFCGPLEEASLPKRAGTCRGSSQEQALQDPARASGSRGRRAANLRVCQAGRDEALGEAAHSLGPGDGQQLLGEAGGLAGGRVKRCKQVRGQKRGDGGGGGRGSQPHSWHPKVAFQKTPQLSLEVEGWKLHP